MDRPEEIVKRDFGRALTKARKKAGFRTATAFAHALRVESARYRYWERGQAMPDVATVTRICVLLDVEPNDLLPHAVKKKTVSSTKHRHLEPAE